MLTSLALIFLIGYLCSIIFKKMKLPPLLGMLIAGVLLGPYVFNLLDSSILLISADLRELALIVILTRAGLALDIKDLKEIGKPAILLCFVPAIFEITAIVLIAPLLFDITLLDAAILGTVVAAVSPAVVVPKMLSLMEKGYGKDKKIPQMIMAGASVDDILVIILFFSFLKIGTGEAISTFNFIKIPLNIIFGIGIGIGCGYILFRIFKKFSIRDSQKVIIMLSVSFILVALEEIAVNTFPFSGLLAVMFIGITLLKKNQDLAARLSAKFAKLWVGAEIILFVLVGATVNILVVKEVGLLAILLILSALIFRAIGVIISTSKGNLEKKEKLFCISAYIPKATVQAAIGAIPLSMGIASGDLILSIAVLAIVITAPLGAILTDYTSKFLKH